MSRNWDGSGDFADGTSAVSAEPLTICCWATVSALGSNRVIFDVAASASANNAYRIGMDASNNVIAVTQTGAVALSTATTTAAVGSADSWFHACGVFASDTDRRAFLNGANKGTNATSRNPSAVNSVCFGDRVSHAQNSPHSGLIAHAAMWNIALSDADVLMLGLGLDPRLVRPDALVGYWPLFGNASPEPDWVGGNNLTLTNTTKSESAPRIIRPVQRKLILPKAATPQSVVPDVATVTGDAVDTTIALGAVTQTPDVATVTASVADPTVVLGAVTQTPDVATVAATVADTTVVITGTATVVPDVATVAASVADPTIVLGAVTQTVDVATVTASVVDPSVVLGAVTLVPDVATVAATVADPTIVLGAVSIAVDVASVAVTAEDSAVVFTVAVEVATVAASVADPTVTLGAVAVVPDVASVAVTAADPTVNVSVQVDVATVRVDATEDRKVDVETADVAVTASDATITGNQTITVDVATVAVTAVDPTIVLGAVTQAVDVATVTASAVDPTIVLGAVTQVPEVAVVAATAADPTIVLGAVSVVPDVATVVVTAADPTPIQTILVTVDVATVTASAADPTVTLGAVTVAVEAAIVSASADDPTISLGNLLVAVLEASVAVVVGDPAASGTGSVSAQPEVATITIAVSDALIPVRVPVDVATVRVDAGDLRFVDVEPTDLPVAVSDPTVFQWASAAQRQPGAIYRPHRRAEADTRIRRPDGPDQFPYRQQ